MDAWFADSIERRANLCQRVADDMGIAAEAIEKDLWVCWTLRELFGDPEVGPHLTFKGGTSLSKCYGLIERFSEDIDIVVDRAMLSCPTDCELIAMSGGKRRAAIERLRASSIEYAESRIRPMLSERLRLLSPGTPLANVETDDQVTERDTLLVRYESCLGGGPSYLRPVVRIELGSRSDTDPMEVRDVVPYAARGLETGLVRSGFQVRTVTPSRTFWEKVCLLHEEQARARPVRARLARHYYDLSRLVRAVTLEEAIEDAALFARIVEHRRLFFPLGAKAQGTLAPGTLRITPNEASLPEWRADYQRMRDTMFFGEPPTFEQLMNDAREIESAVNAMRSASDTRIDPTE